MKSIKSLIAIIISVFFVLGISGCGLISKTPEAEKKTAVASVNGEDVTKDDFEKRLNPLLEQYKSVYGADFFTKQPQYLSSIKEQLLNAMAKEKLELQKAAELKLTVSDKNVETEVNKQLADMIKYYGGEKKYEEKLKEAKLTPEGFKQTILEQEKIRLTIKKLKEYITRDVKASEQDLINYYYANQYNYTEKPNTMNVSHILLPTEAEANKVLKEINAGLKYTDAAKKYGTDGTKDKGGLLGDMEYTTTEYDKQFVNGAIATRTGTVSRPVKTQFGFHLIKVNSRKEYKLKPFDKVKAGIKTTVLTQKKDELYNTTYTAWEEKAKIETHPELIQ